MSRRWMFPVVMALALMVSPRPQAQSWGAAAPDAGEPKNVIVLIADGAGYNMLHATRLWSGEPLAMDGPEWTKLALATHALRRGRAFRPDVPALAQDPGMAYDPRRVYDVTPVHGEHRVRMFGVEIAYPRGFAGYELLRRTAPDSAATASALFTGVPTYNGAINVNGERRPVESVAEAAHRAGKRIGVVTTVPWTHATPAAAAGAHNVSRDNYDEIAAEILDAGIVDVLAGPGHPDYDHDGKRRRTAEHKFYGERDWQALAAGTRTDVRGDRWTLIEETAAILALAEDAAATPAGALVIVPRAGWTLQQMRKGTDRNGDGKVNESDAFETRPGVDPINPGLPALPDLARAALNVVDSDEDGFFLVIEGGAVDWAMHDNQLGRAIEEYLEFNEAVKLVCAYLDAGTNGNTWQNTLVMVTADHDHLLYGPDADRVPFQELQDRGAGEMPGYRWLSNSHSNSLVPLFGRGAGSERLSPLADEIDVYENGTHRFGRGAFLHQAEVGRLLMLLAARERPGSNDE